MTDERYSNREFTSIAEVHAICKGVWRVPLRKLPDFLYAKCSLYHEHKFYTRCGVARFVVTR